MLCRAIKDAEGVIITRRKTLQDAEVQANDARKRWVLLLSFLHVQLQSMILNVHRLSAASNCRTQQLHMA